MTPSFVFRYAAVLCLSILTATPATAVVTTSTVNFFAYNFFQPNGPENGIPASLESITGKFSVTFDAGVTYLVPTLGVTVHSLDALLTNGDHDRDIPIGPATFVYTPGSHFGVQFANPLIEIYSISFDANALLSTGSGISNARQVVYEHRTPMQFSYDYTYSVTAVPGIPEPATYAMLILGLAFVGTLAKARRH